MLFLDWDARRTLPQTPKSSHCAEQSSGFLGTAKWQIKAHTCSLTKTVEQRKGGLDFKTFFFFFFPPCNNHMGSTASQHLYRFSCIPPSHQGNSMNKQTHFFLPTTYVKQKGNISSWNSSEGEKKKKYNNAISLSFWKKKKKMVLVLKMLLERGSQPQEGTSQFSDILGP